MTTPQPHDASERVTFQVQTRAEIGPFRDYGEQDGDFAVTISRARDAQQFSAGVRILAFLSGSFYRVIWADGDYEADVHADPVVQPAFRWSDAPCRLLSLPERARQFAHNYSTEYRCMLPETSRAETDALEAMAYFLYVSMTKPDEEWDADPEVIEAAILVIWEQLPELHRVHTEIAILGQERRRAIVNRFNSALPGLNYVIPDDAEFEIGYHDLLHLVRLADAEGVDLMDDYADPWETRCTADTPCPQRARDGATCDHA
jgi:hypothetical protein